MYILGRVKTLHPKIHAGLLSTTEEAEKDDTYPNITVLVANLYPFDKVFTEEKMDSDLAMSLMDIGGHAMIRAAIKNYKKVIPIIHQNDYQRFMDDFDNIVNIDYAKLASMYITAYDAMITKYFMNDKCVLRMYMTDKSLKYGTNPHQTDAATNLIDKTGESPFTIKQGSCFVLKHTFFYLTFC